MDTIEAIGKDRVRKATSDHVNEKIDNQTRENIAAYSIASKEMLQARIEDLDRVWDIERTLELNASLVALTGVVLAATVNKDGCCFPDLSRLFLRNMRSRVGARQSHCSDDWAYARKKRSMRKNMHC